MKKRNIIFVFNCGRSGSQTIAKEFGLEHEPDECRPNIEKLKKRIRQAWGRGQDYYGETGYYWIDKIDLLKDEFPEAIFLHLVRDGRNVVKSWWRKRHYMYDEDEKDPWRNRELPIQGFLEMSRFEKLCYWWAYWNEEIEKRVKSRIRLEDIGHRLTKYNAGGGRVYLKRVGEKGYDIVDSQISLDWGKEREKEFQKICGKLMKRYGYN